MLETNFGFHSPVIQKRLYNNYKRFRGVITYDTALEIIKYGNGGIIPITTDKTPEELQQLSYTYMYKGFDRFRMSVSRRTTLDTETLELLSKLVSDLQYPCTSKKDEGIIPRAVQEVVLFYKDDLECINTYLKGYHFKIELGDRNIHTASFIKGLCKLANKLLAGFRASDRLARIKIYQSNDYSTQEPQIAPEDLKPTYHSILAVGYEPLSVPRTSPDREELVDSVDRNLDIVELQYTIEKKLT